RCESKRRWNRSTIRPHESLSIFRKRIHETQARSAPSKGVSPLRSATALQNALLHSSTNRCVETFWTAVAGRSGDTPLDTLYTVHDLRLRLDSRRTAVVEGQSPHPFPLE